MEIKSPLKNKPKKKKRKKVTYDINKFPFRILGLSDDNMAYFIGRHNRFIDTPISNLNKNTLLRLANIDWWRNNFGYEGKLSWDYPIDFVLEVLSQIDFDLSVICGRGACRGINDEICYHDGYETIGKIPKDKLFLRKTRKDIGLSCQSIDLNIVKEVAQTVGRMSFETPSDSIRILGWSILAPFAGALPWRPAGLITGPSGSGKTTVIDFIVRPLALPHIFSGGYTTEAGVRQHIKNDATAIVIEEAETDTKKKKDLRNDLFSLMRQSTSDNAPKVAKGTKDGKGTLFNMRSMFLFAAISPEIEAIADDNRIFRVNMIQGNNADWPEIRSKLLELITPDNCRKIRATTWRKLPEIIEFSNKLAPLIQDMTKMDIRACLADGMLLSSYWLVLKGTDNLEEDQIKNFIKLFYDMSPVEFQRDETDELLDRILDEKIIVDKPERLTLTLREILKASYKGTISWTGFDGNLNSNEIMYLKKTAGRYGLGCFEDGSIAVASNHHEIMKITGKGRGYQRQLYRHKDLIDKQKPVNLSGKTRRCVIIGNVLKGDQNASIYKES